MYKATAGWICLDTLVHDALLVVSSYYIIQAALRHPESPMIQKDFPHGPCISAGTTTNSSPGVAHGASRTSPGQGYGAWGSGAMGAIHVFLLITSLGIIIIFNMVGKCWKIKQNWNMLKRFEKYWSEQPECLWTLFRLLRLVMLQIFGHPGSSSLTSLLTSDWNAPSSRIYWAFGPGIQTCQSKLLADNFVHIWIEHISKPC